MNLEKIEKTINEAFEKSDWLGENADKTITRAMIEP